MHSDERILHEESGGTTWKPLYRCCVMRKVISKEVATGGRFRFFSGLWMLTPIENSDYLFRAVLQ